MPLTRRSTGLTTGASPAPAARARALNEATPGEGREIPQATIARLPIYHRVLGTMHDRGVHTVCSDDLARACGVSAAMLRKDLSYLGSYGTRGVGYHVTSLAFHISRELGASVPYGVVLVGFGNLGRALASYRAFALRGFTLVGIFDSDPRTIGEPVLIGEDPLRVQSVDHLSEVVRSTGARIGVIATPGEAAQPVCDRLVDAGIRSILNFAPAVLAVPLDVELRKVDLAVELQILAFHEQRRVDEADQVAHA
ncbi:MAG: redox-sensing transcriptional repressor Rex [Actinomycetales bacterium]